MFQGVHILDNNSNMALARQGVLNKKSSILFDIKFIPRLI